MRHRTTLLTIVLLAAACLLVAALLRKASSQQPRATGIVYDTGATRAELEDACPDYGADAAFGAVPIEEARRVARHFAELRWNGCTIGPCFPACAPDGMNEVYFFTVYRKPAPQTTGRLAAVIVGAHEGREPFIASFAGPPPQVALHDMAIAVQRAISGAKNPGEPTVLWLPPMFVYFQFAPADGKAAGTLLEAKGGELTVASLAGWQRERLQDAVLQHRQQKWQKLRETLHD